MLDLKSEIYDTLPIEEENKLFELMNDGCSKSRDELIRHNIRYCIKLANQYNSQSFTLDDFIGEAIIGLMKALDMYKPQGSRFCSFATYWIKEQLTQAMRLDKLVHIPQNRQVKISKTKKMFKDTDDEMPQSVIDMMESTKMGSLDVPIMSEGSSMGTGLDSVMDNEESPEDTHNRNFDVSTLDSALSTLTHRQEMVIRGLFELDGFVLTLHDLGTKFGVSHNMIDLEKRAALSRLRKMPIIKDIFGVMVDYT